MARAQIAVAHSMLVSVRHMLTRDEHSADLGPDSLAKRNDEALPAAWSASSSVSATPWSSTPSPNPETAEEPEDGLRPPPRTRLQLTHSRVCVGS